MTINEYQCTAVTAKLQVLFEAIQYIQGSGILFGLSG